MDFDKLVSYIKKVLPDIKPDPENRLDELGICSYDMMLILAMAERNYYYADFDKIRPDMTLMEFCNVFEKGVV